MTNMADNVKRTLGKETKIASVYNTIEKVNIIQSLLRPTNTTLK